MVVTTAGKTVDRLVMSVFKELERRRKCQLEYWNTDLLYRFSEDQCVDKLESNVYHLIVTITL